MQTSAKIVLATRNPEICDFMLTFRAHKYTTGQLLGRHWRGVSGETRTRNCKSQSGLSTLNCLFLKHVPLLAFGAGFGFPHSDTAKICVSVVSKLSPSRHLAQEFSVAAAEHDVVGDER